MIHKSMKKESRFIPLGVKKRVKKIKGLWMFLIVLSLLGGQTVVAQELKAHGYNLYYYDNKKNGEVDYLIDDADNLSNIPIEVKSGKDYTVHSALDKFMSNDEYHIQRAYVLSNEQRVYTEKGITYIPIYYIMFFQNVSHVVEQFLD